MTSLLEGPTQETFPQFSLRAAKAVLSSVLPSLLSLLLVFVRIKRSFSLPRQLFLLSKLPFRLQESERFWSEEVQDSGSSSLRRKALERALNHPFPAHVVFFLWWWPASSSCVTLALHDPFSRNLLAFELLALPCVCCLALPCAEALCPLPLVSGARTP